MEWGFGLAGLIEVIASIQCAVSEVLSGGTVDCIRSTLGNDIDDRSSAAAVFRCEVREDIHFRNGVDRKNGRGRPEDSSFVNGWVIAVTVVHIGAVQQIIVGAATGAVHGKIAEGNG